MNTKRIKIGVVDNDVLAVRALRDVLGGAGTPISVSWTAVSGLDALRHCQNKAERPEVLLTDIEMPGFSGIELSKQLARQIPSIRVIGVTAFDIPDSQRRMKGSGMSAVLAKETSTEQMVHEIGKVVGNVEAMAWKDQQVDVMPRSIDLTENEMNILYLVRNGCTNMAIARDLHISVSTVKTHLEKTYRKLDVHNRAEAIAVFEQLKRA